MQNSIVIKTPDGQVEIYTNELDQLVDEFVRDMDEEMMYKPSTWLAVLKHIYMECFKPQKKLHYNAGSILNDNPEAIEAIWDWYVSTAYKFGKTPTILQFGILTGIDRTTIQTWKNGTWRTANKTYSLTAKKMYAEAEAALENRTIESNGIGAIFALKANHGWRETAPVSEPEMLTQRPYETPEQIAAKYADYTEKPTLPAELLED